MLENIFVSAEHKTFWAKAGEVLQTFARMWLCMLLVVVLFNAFGMLTGSFSTNIPILGASINLLLHSEHLTLVQALHSPTMLAAVLGTIVGAPLVEEILFRWLVCGLASDKDGKILPQGKGLGIILAGSMILFGLAHGNWFFSVMLQGVGGFWLARLWFRNGTNHVSSYWSCVTAHSLYNISVVATIWLMSR